jgi:hypothetical protein
MTRLPITDFRPQLSEVLSILRTALRPCPWPERLELLDSAVQMVLLRLRVDALHLLAHRD